MTLKPLKRSRAKRSCDFCRKRKARCDADVSVPCSNCKAWGLECEFLAVPKKRGPPNLRVQELEVRCQKLEYFIETLTKKTIDEIEHEGFLTPIKSPIINVYQDNEIPAKDTEVNAFNSIKYIGRSAGFQPLDQMLFKHFSNFFIRWPGREDIALKIIPENEIMILRTGISASGKVATKINMGLSFCSSIFDEQKPELDNSHGIFPPGAVKDRALNLYFSHIHAFLPIIDLSKFERDGSSIVVQAVFAVAFQFAFNNFANAFKNSDQYAKYYFQQTINNLEETYNPTIEHIQATILLVLYLDMEETNVEPMQWYILGRAVRMIQDLGLHRSCSNLNISRSEKETRRRIFYACYVFDRLISARSGKPLSLPERDFDTEKPVPFELSDSDNSKNKPEYCYFLFIIDICEIIGQILKAFYAIKPEYNIVHDESKYYSLVTLFEQSLENWRVSMDKSFQDGGFPQAQKDNLLLLFYTTILLLHRPLLENHLFHSKGKQKADTSLPKSFQRCVNMADNIIKLIQEKQVFSSYPESCTLLCTPTILIYAMFQSALVYFALIIWDRSSTQSLFRLEHAIEQLKKHQKLVSARRAVYILTRFVILNDVTIDIKSKVTEDIFTSQEDTQSQPFSKVEASTSKRGGDATSQVPNQQHLQHIQHIPHQIPMNPQTTENLFNHNYINTVAPFQDMQPFMFPQSGMYPPVQPGFLMNPDWSNFDYFNEKTSPSSKT